MNIIAKNLRGGGKTLNYLLAGVIALAASGAWADTNQKFLFVGQNSGLSDWAIGSSWIYSNGNSGSAGNWKATSGKPDDFNYDVYFRSPMKAKNGNTYSYRSDWNHIVTFSGAQKVGATPQPLHLDAGSSAENPIVFTAMDSSYGLTSSSTLNIAETADGYLRIDSGTYSFGHVVLANGSGKTGVLTMNGGTLKILNNYARIGCGGGTGILTVKTGAVFDNSEATGNGGNLTLGQDANSSGTLNVEGGEVTVKGYIPMNYNAGALTSIINVTDGGVLACNKIYLNNPGQGGTINIDGGTLKACGSNASYFSSFITADNSLNVYIGANGATVDTDGHDITIGEDFQEATSSPGGGLTVTGGGTATFPNMGDISGAFAVGENTALHWFDQDGGTVSVTCGIASLALGAGSTLYIDGNATAVEPLPSTVTTTATAENKATIEISFSAIPAAGTSFTLFPAASADVFDVKPRLGGLELPHETTIDNGNLVLTITAEDYTWNGTQTNWGDADAWTKGGALATWSDGNNAIFGTANAAATLAADASVAEVRFTADAAISGSSALTAPSVSVASGVSAAISTPTAGALEKTGAGTLTLSSSRTAQTDVAEGTLVMSGAGTTLDWSGVTLGTEVGKTAILKFEGGATVASESSMGNLYICPSGNDGLAAELYKDGGDWSLGSGSYNMVLAEAKNSTARFYHRGGTLTLGRYVRIGWNNASDSGEALIEISGGTVAHTQSSGQGYVDVGSAGAPGFRGILSVKTNGTFSTVANLVVGGNGAGTLDIDGGTASVANGIVMPCYGEGNTAGEDCYIDIKNGGTLSTKSIQYGSSASSHGAADAAITFDDGTLKAAADGTLIAANAKLTVEVASGGGTIDANGKNVTIAEELAGVGGMTYKGSGTVTLSVAPTYSGTTAVEVGTALVVPDAIAGANLSFAIPDGLASGAYKVVAISGGGAFASDVLSTATLPSGANMRFYLDNGGTEIWCAYSSNASDHIWIGGSTGSLNEGANWLSGNVPASGTTAIIGSASAATLTNPEGSGFAATTIVVPKDSAAVTVSGAAFSGITKIENYSTSQIEFLNAVTFAANVNVVQSPGVIKFTGGATGVQLGTATAIHGTYNFTKAGDLTEIGGTTVKSDGVYNLLDGTFYKHTADFHMEAGGEAMVKNAKISHASSRTLLGTFNGLFFVTNQFVVSGNSTHYMCSSGSGTFIVNELRVIQDGKIVPADKTIMGPDGIIRGAGYVRVKNGGSHEFGSYADWTMYHNYKGTNTATESPVFYKHSSSSEWSYLTFDTTDYYDNTIGRTITCEAPISAADEASAAKFRVTVKGKGKFVFANTSDGNIFSGGLIVQDTATVEVKANAKPGKGTITLGAGTTLALTAESREFTPLANTLKLPTEGTATLRIDGRRLRHGEHVIASDVTGEPENVKLDGKSSALAGRKATLRVEGGKLYLTIKPDGTMIIVR